MRLIIMAAALRASGQGAAAGALQRRADDGLHGPPLPPPLPVALEERACYTRRWSPQTRWSTTHGAPRHGTGDRWLAHDDEEDKTILQLGGSSPKVLGAATELALKHHTYAGVNLNCGCPSERVAGAGCFGAALMRDPDQVASCVQAMNRHAPVSVKCRIGVVDSVRDLSDDEDELYASLARFVDTVSSEGVSRHRPRGVAVLSGLSPDANRKVPPIMPGIVQRLQSEFPTLEIVTNGEVGSVDEVLERSTGLQGAMVGRDACRRPWHYAVVDEEVFGGTNPMTSRRTLLDAYAHYCDRAEVDLAHDGYSPRRAVLKPALSLSCSTATRVPARSSGRSTRCTRTRPLSGRRRAPGGGGTYRGPARCSTRRRAKGRKISAPGGGGGVMFCSARPDCLKLLAACKTLAKFGNNETHAAAPPRTSRSSVSVGKGCLRDPGGDAARAPITQDTRPQSVRTISTLSAETAPRPRASTRRQRPWPAAPRRREYDGDAPGAPGGIMPLRARELVMRGSPGKVYERPVTADGTRTEALAQDQVPNFLRRPSTAGSTGGRTLRRPKDRATLSQQEATKTLSLSLELSDALVNFGVLKQGFRYTCSRHSPIDRLPDSDGTTSAV